MCKKGLNLIIIIIFCLGFTACSPSQSNLDAQATQVMMDFFATQTAAPTATVTLTPAPTLTPTPVPGRFINPPEMLETVYFPDWFWLYNAANQRVGWTWGKELKYLPSMYYQGNYIIGFSMILNEPMEDEQNIFQELISNALQYFISDKAIDQINQIIQNQTDYQQYEEEIESFKVVYTIYSNTEKKKVLMLEVSQD